MRTRIVPILTVVFVAFAAWTAPPVSGTGASQWNDAPASPTPRPALLVNGSASPIMVAPGAVVSVAVSGGSGVARDWVAKYRATAPNTQYYPDYQYLNGTQTPPTTGVSSATLSFTMPIAAGNYDFRLLHNDTFVVLGASPIVTVSGAPVVLVNGSASPINVVPGAVVTVSVANGPALARDWVGTYSAAASNTQYLNYLYLNGTRTPPATGVSSATLSFTMPMLAGAYNFRLLQSDTFTVLAVSPTVTAGP